ncbi:hypothetical protein lerEdw1_001072 [Lerista edwardsae]|nr:hypothetical protein lerEdw1_001072 [Lerista edwardsae]
MAKLGWSCLFLLGLSGPLSVALPVASSSEISYWLSAVNNNARLNLDALHGRTRGRLRQALPRLLGTQVDDNPKEADLGPNSFTPRETVKEVSLTRKEAVMLKTNPSYPPLQSTE